MEKLPLSTLSSSLWAGELHLHQGSIWLPASHGSCEARPDLGWTSPFYLREIQLLGCCGSGTQEIKKAVFLFLGGVQIHLARSSASHQSEGASISSSFLFFFFFLYLKYYHDLERTFYWMFICQTRYNS